MKVILGSQSPRRKQLLESLGYDVEVRVSGVDESAIHHAHKPASTKLLKRDNKGFIMEALPEALHAPTTRPETPAELTQMLALAKNAALQKEVPKDAVVITADTVVSCGGLIYEKAEDEAAAYQWLTSFQGKDVSVHTSAVIHDEQSGETFVFTDDARISFKPIPAKIRDELARHAIEAGVAGGFDIADARLKPYVRIVGDMSTIRGLPTAQVDQCLKLIEKRRIRVQVRALYKAHDLARYVSSAVALLEKHPTFVNASVVLAYEPIVAVEIPFVHELMRRHPEKQWYFPRVLPERDMEFIDQHDDVFFPGSEPICVIVPCMAVDRRGVRLGKGGGYYDHFILKHPHVREGTMVVVPDFAFLPLVPKEVHDMTVAHVIVAKER